MSKDAKAKYKNLWSDASDKAGKDLSKLLNIPDTILDDILDGKNLDFFRKNCCKEIFALIKKLRDALKKLLN